MQKFFKPNKNQKCFLHFRVEASLVLLNGHGLVKHSANKVVAILKERSK